MTNVEASSELRRQLLERLRKGELKSPGEPAQASIPASHGADIPLSCGQQQVWLHSAFSPGAPIYNESITIRKCGPLDPMVFESAFNEMVRRHAIWRTGFVDVAGEIRQVVHPEVQVSLPLIDFSNLPADAAESEALRISGEDARRLFDPANPPLLRARLIRVTPDDHRLYLTFHHIVFDGVSVYRVLLPELAIVYRAYLMGRPSPLPALPIQYGDFARWQRKKLADADYARQLNYWRETLKAETPPLELPESDVSARDAASGHAAAPGWAAGMETFALSARLSQSIKRLAAAEGASLYMVLLAAFHVVLHRYSGQTEITTGAVVSTRNRPELESLIGFLLNTLVLRSQVEPAHSFRGFLKGVRNTVLNALANSDVPFDAVVRELAPKRHATRNALFQVLFSLRPAADAFPAGWDLTEFDVHSGGSGFDLFVDIVDRPGGLHGRAIYSAALFDPATVQRMIGHLQRLLEGITSDPDRPIALLPLLTDEESRSILTAGSGLSTNLRDSTVAGLFEDVAARFPDRLAAVFERQQLTFQELDQRANDFAAKLRIAGAKPGMLVSISVDRSLEMLVALIGILKSGTAYLPIDPSLPEERRAFILRDAHPDLQITSTDLTIAGSKAQLPAAYPGLAYILYTSGSTGVPKGVEVPQSAVVNFLRSMRREPGFSSSDTLLAITTLSFDIAALEMFLPLVSGGTLVIAPRKTVSDPQLLIEAIRSSNCTVMQGTPAVWRSLIEAGWRGNPRLKILCGGESLSRSLADRLLPRCRELWNMYGPTETTIWSTVHRVEPGEGPVPIGKPIGNTQVYVLDRHLQLLPAGVKGELYIGGDGVARGYVARPDLTRERFLPNPFRPGERIYRTGDLARRRPNGSLEILGRIDDQVKVRGFRVELQEIEQTLLRYPGVRAAAVKTWRDASGENSLVAYLVGAAESAELRRHLAGTLPDYMIPSRFLELPSLPLTPNGKLDRKALPEPGRLQPSAGERTGPRNETERRVAAIWAALLNLSFPDVHEDFFRLGGHSLLAVTMLRNIDIEFGIRLSISALFENPTIAGLAALLDRDRGAATEDSSGQPILHWMYAGAYCRHLASHLRPAYRLEGVSLPQEMESTITAADGLEDLARLMVKEIRKNSPRGPYNIAGWCLSGILAYEVAVQLVELGEELGLVALVGAPNPQHYSAIPKIERAKSKLRHHWHHVKQLDVTGVARYLIDRARYQWKELNPLQSQHFERVLLDLALRYEPKPLNARVALFQGEDRPSVVDYSEGWKHLVTGEFTAYDIPGNHVTSLEEPHAAALGEKMKACLHLASDR